MAAQILPLPSVKAPCDPFGHYVRLGDSGHRQLADLHAGGRFSPKRAVVDASRLHHQKELVEALRASGTQIVLDTKAAELTAERRFAGLAAGAPWSKSGNGRPLTPGHFAQGSREDVIGQIARFAVEHQIHTVLSPGHYLREGTKSRWFAVDRDACIALRAALDRVGGHHISIDYELIMPHVSLNDVDERGHIVETLKDLPFDNLWLRASVKPIVADYLGGLVGLAAAYFGAISGFAEGVGERERFDAREWHKPPKVHEEDEEFGRVTRIAISGFGRSVTVSELKQLHDAKGGRRLVACADRNCCLHGFPDMLANPKRHGLYQRTLQIREIEKIPNLNRAQHFLDGEMARADRLARQIKDLNLTDENLASRMRAHGDRMEKLRSTLEHFHEMRGNDGPRALPVVERKAAQDRRGHVSS
jgi:hypothetical protein